MTLAGICPSAQFALAQKLWIVLKVHACALAAGASAAASKAPANASARIVGRFLDCVLICASARYGKSSNTVPPFVLPPPTVVPNRSPSESSSSAPEGWTPSAQAAFRQKL